MSISLRIHRESPVHRDRVCMESPAHKERICMIHSPARKEQIHLAHPWHTWHPLRIHTMGLTVQANLPLLYRLVSSFQCFVHHGSVDEIKSQSNGKRPATQLGRDQTTRQAKRPRKQHRHTTESNARSASNAENGPIANDTPGPSRAPRSRTQTSRSGYLIGDACFEAIPPSESSSDAELAEPTILQTANNDSSAGSHIPTEGTVHPPRTPALYAYVGDGASNGPLEDRRPPPPPTAPESGLARQSGLMPEPKLAHNSAPEHSPELGIDHNTNHEQSKQVRNSLPTIEFFFSVNVSHNENERWQPSIPFQKLSLQGLIDELPLRDNFSGLSIVLETGKMNFAENVSCGNEDQFTSIKARFTKKIEAIRNKAEPNVKRLTMEIIIQPHTEKGTDKEGSDDDEAAVVF